MAEIELAVAVEHLAVGRGEEPMDEGLRRGSVQHLAAVIHEAAVEAEPQPGSRMDVEVARAQAYGLAQQRFDRDGRRAGRDGSRRCCGRPHRHGHRRRGRRGPLRDHVLLHHHQLLELARLQVAQLEEDLAQAGVVPAAGLLPGGLGELVHADQLVVDGQAAEQRRVFGLGHIL